MTNDTGLISTSVLAERLGLVRPTTPEEAHAQAIARGALCTRCTLYGQRRGPVLGQVVPGAKLAIGGEAPGKHEVESGRVFDAWSGDRLDEGLAAGGLLRADLTVINSIGCFPPGSFEEYHRSLSRSKDQLAPAEACYPRFARDLDESGSKVLLAIGKQALKAICQYVGIPFGAKAAFHKRQAEARDDDPLDDDEEHGAFALSIKSQHAAPIPLPDGRVLIASLHPAFAGRGARSWLPWISGPQGAIARAARIALRDGKLDWKPAEHVVLFPTIEQVEAFSAACVETRAHVTIDTETDSADVYTAKLRLVGARAKLDGERVAMPIPYRWRDGRWYWPDLTTRRRMEAAVLTILVHCPLIFHNGNYDTIILRSEGIWVPELNRKVWFDTMIADNDCGCNDMPHDLGSATVRRFEVRLWKFDVDHKAAAGVDTDHDLHVYNADDLEGTAQLAEAELDELIAHDAIETFAVDTALLPILRDMGELGLLVDEVRRGELSALYNAAAMRLSFRIKKAVGRIDFNPRSTQQIAAWLFGQMGVLPALGTDGYEWIEGESASTGAPALTRILDRGGLPPSVRETLDALIEFKTIDKVRGTNIDRLHVRQTDEMHRLSEGRTAPAIKKISLVDLSDDPEEAEDEILLERDALSHLQFVYKLHSTPSGRTSSSPNVQNVPKRAWGRVDLRSAFVAPPGHVLVHADLKQVEARIYAKDAGDRLLLKALDEGLDVHSWTWAILNAKPGSSDSTLRALYDRFVAMKTGAAEEQALIEFYRTISKRIRYLVLYGGEKLKMFDTLYNERDKATGARPFKGVLRSDVNRWYDALIAASPELEIWAAGVDREVREHQRVREGFHGRQRWLKGGADKKNAPRNLKIQGRAAAYKNEALLRVDEIIPHGKWSRWTGLVLDVHDDIGLYVPESRADEAKAILKRSMTFDYDGMPIIPDEPSASKRWGKI